MASRVVRVLKRQQFTVPGNGQGLTTTLPIASNLDTSPYKEAVAVARLHDVEWYTTAAETIAFQIKEDGYTEEDPTLNFTGNTLNALSSLKFTENIPADVPPSMKTVSLTLSYPLPPMIKVDLVVEHQSNNYDMVFVVSLDLVLRD
jgi:hypothetical protein